MPNKGQVFRPDRDGTHRAQFEKNKKIIYATQTICGVCGKPVDMHLKWPDPLSKSVDHIIPVQKGGHPSALENLQLAHLGCNRQKSTKLIEPKLLTEEAKIDNSILPHSIDWLNRAEKQTKKKGILR